MLTQPALRRLLLILLLAFPASPAHAQVFTPTSGMRATPSTVTLDGAGDRGSLILGTRSTTYSGVQVLDARGRPATGITASLGRMGVRGLPVTVRTTDAAAGTYRLRLVQGRGYRGVDAVIRVTRTRVNEAPEIVSIDLPTQVHPARPLEVRIRARDDGSVREFRATWSGGSTSTRVASSSDATATMTLTGLPTGRQQIRFQAIDDEGRVSATITRAVAVLRNEVPVITRAEPLEGREGERGGAWVEARDDGGIARAFATWNGLRIDGDVQPTSSDGTEARIEFTVPNAPAGTHTMLVFVTDNSEDTAPARSVEWTVAPAVRQPRLAGLRVNDPRVYPGEALAVVVELDAPAPSEGVRYFVSSQGAELRHPSTILIDAGRTSATLNVSPPPGATPGSVTLRVANGTEDVETAITVRPAPFRPRTIRVGTFRFVMPQLSLTLYDPNLSLVSWSTTYIACCTP